MDPNPNPNPNPNANPNEVSSGEKGTYLVSHLLCDLARVVRGVIVQSALPFVVVLCPLALIDQPPLAAPRALDGDTPPRWLRRRRRRLRTHHFRAHHLFERVALQRRDRLRPGLGGGPRLEPGFVNVDLVNLRLGQRRW